MKAKLVFNLPEEKYEFESAVDGTKWRIAMVNVSRYLRDLDKYGNEDSVKISTIREKIDSILMDHDLHLD
jgi:hypothetical protein